VDKHLQELGLAVRFRPANPLSASDPPVPDVDTRTVVLERGSVHAEGAYPLPCDIVCDQDVAVPVRDGAQLRADVFRPSTDAPVPVILAYTPYCKRGGWWNENFNATKFGVAPGVLSGLQAFEAPDPGFWCDQGYAVAFVDAAGTSHSGGDEVFLGTASARNVYDVIEWLAGRQWCTGKVGMAGNSQLAMIQWAVAALRPPHLAAIAPWEGLVDVYREVNVRGGIPDTKFHEQDITAFIYGENDTEDLAANIDRYPLVNAYWADKRPALADITIPAYVVASWTSAIHPHGTLQGFREISSEHKWLRVHNDQSGSTAPTRTTSATCNGSSTATSRTCPTTGSARPGSGCPCSTPEAPTSSVVRRTSGRCRGSGGAPSTWMLARPRCRRTCHPRRRRPSTTAPT
jgi:predicted acyl esterase